MQTYDVFLEVEDMVKGLSVEENMEIIKIDYSAESQYMGEICFRDPETGCKYSIRIDKEEAE